MALSTLRFTLNKSLLGKPAFFISRITQNSLAMSIHKDFKLNPTTISAHKEMQQFWDKNLALKRPNSPWIIYMPHLPMLTSLTHRVTGIAMGVVFYTFSISVLLAPGDFPSYVEFIKNLDISKFLLFPAKTIVAFPLVYHYINGIRHLSWDAGYGYELKTQYKTGKVIVLSAVAISALLASLSYL